MPIQLLPKLIIGIIRACSGTSGTSVWLLLPARCRNRTRCDHGEIQSFFVLDGGHSVRGLLIASCSCVPRRCRYPQSVNRLEEEWYRGPRGLWHGYGYDLQDGEVHVPGARDGHHFAAHKKRFRSRNCTFLRRLIMSVTCGSPRWRILHSCNPVGKRIFSQGSSSVSYGSIQDQGLLMHSF